MTFVVGRRYLFLGWRGRYRSGAFASCEGHRSHDLAYRVAHCAHREAISLRCQVDGAVDLVLPGRFGWTLRAVSSVVGACPREWSHAVQRRQSPWRFPVAGPSLAVGVDGVLALILRPVSVDSGALSTRLPLAVRSASGSLVVARQCVRRGSRPVSRSRLPPDLPHLGRAAWRPYHRADAAKNGGQYNRIGDICQRVGEKRGNCARSA